MITLVFPLGKRHTHWDTKIPMAIKREYLGVFGTLPSTAQNKSEWLTCYLINPQIYSIKIGRGRFTRMPVKLKFQDLHLGGSCHNSERVQYVIVWLYACCCCCLQKQDILMASSLNDWFNLISHTFTFRLVLKGLGQF